MKKIGKVLTLTMVAMLLVSSLSAFAATNPTESSSAFLKAVASADKVSVGDTFKVSVYGGITDVSDAYFDTGVQIDLHYDKTVFNVTVESKNEGFDNEVIDACVAPYDTEIIAEENDNEIFIAPVGAMTVDANTPLLTLNVTALKEGSFGMYFDVNENWATHGMITFTPALNNISITNMSVTVGGGSTPVEPKAEIDTNDDVKSNEITLDNGTKYINVPTYVGKVAVSGELNGKNVKITPVVKYNGTDVTSTLKKVDSIIIPGASFDKGAKIEFKFAIVGAPTTGTIDLSATAAPVE